MNIGREQIMIKLNKLIPSPRYRG